MVGSCRSLSGGVDGADIHRDRRGSGSPVAREAVEHIGALYAIDASHREFPPAERGHARPRELVPKLAALNTWLHDQRTGSSLARAIDYSLKRWDALARVADDGRYPMDNNAAENAIRPIAIGRKNWLFAGSETAGRRAAAIMGLIATAKANGIEPHVWLTDVLTRLPTTPPEQHDSLLLTNGYRPIA